MNLVTYLDLGPSFVAVAAQGLRSWMALAGSRDGAAEAMLLVEVGRPERIVLVETWTDADQPDGDVAGDARLDPATAAGLCVSPDERTGEPFSVGTARPSGPEALYVLIHVDVIPLNLDAVGSWLKAEAETARSAQGALRYDVWRQVGRPNHFTVIQAWADHAAYARHVESASTRAFRDNLLTVKGALYDERLYRRLD
jgi:quinol monooxygenase YgiN